MRVEPLCLLTVLSLWPIGTSAAAPPSHGRSAAESTSLATVPAEALVTDPPCRYRMLKSFGRPGPGGTPRGRLLQGSDGAIYGTAAYGGGNGFGTVFRLNADGSGFTALTHFDYDTTGAYPVAGLLQGSDGALYGTTSEGGSYGLGTAFKLNADGTGLVVLNNFDGPTSGSYPYASLLQGTDGVLYGTTVEGGSNGLGTVFRVETDGTGFAVLKNFDGLTSGSYPYGELIQGNDGAIYGAAYSGGTSDAGTVFKLNTDGTGFTMLKSFVDSASGTFPYSGLVQGTDGALYGTTSEDATGGSGTVFKLNTDGSAFEVLKHFESFTTGSDPYAALIEGMDGALYGTTSLGGGVAGYGTAFKLNPDGSGFTVIRRLQYQGYGLYPNGGLLQAADGALYGTTPEGSQTAAGTLFRLNPDGSGFTVVFQSFSLVADMSEGGGTLSAGVIQGADGALYGVAFAGGADGFGTIFRLNSDGTGFTVLKDLDHYTTGSRPAGELIQATDGALYGTATTGGTTGVGTVFRLNPDGTGFTVLLNFDRATTGANPHGGVIQGTDGKLYGTANQGGSNNLGTVFRLNRDGTGFTVLKHLSLSPPSSATGANPTSGLIQGADGALYGTTSYGTINFSGTVFKLNPDGTGFTVLKQGGSMSGLMQGADGGLYGTIEAGGSGGGGTVYKLNSNGSGYTVLHNFDFSGTGSTPMAEMVQSSDGTLYGTTERGGHDDSGILFKLNPDGSGFTSIMDFKRATTGARPEGRLFRAASGVIYGSHAAGGSAGGGAVFRFDPFVNHTPPQARCKNVTVAAGPSCTGDASIDDGSSDPDPGDRISVTQEPPGPYPIGATQVTLIVIDRGCASSTCTGTVTVPADTPCDDGNACTLTDTCQLASGCVGADSVTCIPADQCHDAGACNPSTGHCSNPAKTDGTECNDGNACTARDICVDGGCEDGAPVVCDDGNCCTIDACNPAAGCYHTADTTAPVFVQQPSLGTCTLLWPPNHGYADFTVADTGASATSTCGIASMAFASCNSSQPENGSGVADGNSTRDCVYEPGALHLRAERDGACSPFGRVYTMQMVAIDICGNMATSNPFQTGVWHDRATSPTAGTIVHAADGSGTSDTRNGINGTYGPGCGPGNTACGELGQAPDHSDADPEMEIAQNASISVNDLRLDKAAGGGILLAWTEPAHGASINVTRYHVYRLDPVTLVWTRIAEMSKQTTSYLDPVLGDGIDWQYKATAVVK